LRGRLVGEKSYLLEKKASDVYFGLFLGQPWRVLVLLPFFAGLMAGGGPTAKLVSSKGRHLKFFLYPPHDTLRRSHWEHDGFVSSHFNRFALQVIQPGRHEVIGSAFCADSWARCAQFNCMFHFFRSDKHRTITTLCLPWFLS